VLYLDSSALVKQYVEETGSRAMNAKIESESAALERPFTSVLAYPEVHAALVKKFRKNLLTAEELRHAQKQFEPDWAFGISEIPLDASVLASIREAVRRFPLSGADAVHLASALWLRDALAARGNSAGLTFATSDMRLAEAAQGFGLEVFNPETV